MTQRQGLFWVIAIVALLAGCGGSGQDFVVTDLQTAQPSALAVRTWNRIAIDASGFDHMPQGGGEQLFPPLASRAMAIVHIAMHDAVQAIQGRYETYLEQPARSPDSSLDAAVAQAAHDTLVALFPSQRSSLDLQLAYDLGAIVEGPQKSEGIAAGQAAAAAILADRHNDGSGVSVQTGDYDYGLLPGEFRPDPLSDFAPIGPQWGQVRPFVLSSSSQFRCPPPPALDSPEYAAAFEETARLGGDGQVTPTERTPEQTNIGLFWAYDGTPSLCAPPRLYNQLALVVSEKVGVVECGDQARLLALLNIAMADAAISAWEAKFHFGLWRPVTGIREAEVGTGPSGLGDGNPNTLGDPTFSPLGSPASNLIEVNFTPPFPTYPSGHATFGGSIFQVLRRYIGTDDVSFTLVSDELNGVTRDNTGVIRDLVPFTFANLSQAERENAESRIYLGIHWRFDAEQGIVMGRRVGDLVFDSILRPR